LIVLRILAIWKMKRVVVAIATGVWGINVIFLIQGIVRIRAVNVPGAGCNVVNMHITKLNLIVLLATDIILLLTMFIGFLRLRLHERSAFGLGRLLWKQGLIWLFIATIAEALPVVFICLNLNGPFNSMFQIPSVVALSIAATRIYRSLVDYASGCTEYLNEPDSVRASGRIERKANTAPFTPIPLSRVEVAINRTYEGDQMLQTSQHGSLISIEGQVCEKPIRQLGLDDDVENGVVSARQVP